MSGYLWIVWYSTSASKNKLWISVAATTPVEACEKAVVLLRENGQDGEIKIVGCQRVVQLLANYVKIVIDVLAQYV